MAFFPKIQSPCPYKGDLASIMDGDVCRMCKRQVFDLTAWTDEARVTFLAGCSEEVCVSYRIPLRPALAAAALSAAWPMAAAAQPAPVAAPVAVVAAPELAGQPAPADAAMDELAIQESVIFVGGIRDPHNVAYAEDPADLAVPELPVVYEERQAAAPTQAAPAEPVRR